MLRAGSLRHQLVLQEDLATQDAAGQPAPSDWTDVATIWGDVRFLSGVEAVKADAPVSLVKCSIRIRNRSGVTSGMRFLEGSTVYDIRSVPPYHVSNEWIDCVCETGANSG